MHNWGYANGPCLHLKCHTVESHQCTIIELTAYELSSVLIVRYGQLLVNCTFNGNRVSKFSNYIFLHETFNY